MEELNEVKTDNHHLLSTFEDQNQTISAKNDQNDSRMVQLITNQEIIIKKQFNCENIEENNENNSSAGTKIKESLKQIHEIILKYPNPKNNVKSAIQEIHQSLKSFQSVLIGKKHAFKNDTIHYGMRDKCSMFLSAAFKNLIFLCSF